MNSLKPQANVSDEKAHSFPLASEQVPCTKTKQKPSYKPLPQRTHDTSLITAFQKSSRGVLREGDMNNFTTTCHEPFAGLGKK